MSLGMLVAFVVYGTFAAFVHELIVGIAAMHSGWFPAFAVALVTLLIGILIGFPPEALVVLAGFSAATGPAFADMGYDLKAGHLLRGEGADPAFEMEGRRQQMIAGMLGFVVAIAVVLASYHIFFANKQTAPINAAFVAGIKAGISMETARSLALWAIPGALLQILGGPRQHEVVRRRPDRRAEQEIPVAHDPAVQLGIDGRVGQGGGKDPEREVVPRLIDEHQALDALEDGPGARDALDLHRPSVETGPA